MDDLDKFIADQAIPIWIRDTAIKAAREMRDNPIGVARSFEALHYALVKRWRNSQVQ